MAISAQQLTPSAAVTAAGQSVEPRQWTGSEIFLQSLVDEGVDTIFGLPGGVILPIYDALPDFDLKHILVRHEQGATHMAEGYARATGKPGVVLVTSGPGATNVVTGIADAYYDSVPLVVFTGNVPSHMLGKDAFQEADIVGITRPCTKHNIIVRRVEDLANAIHEAFHVATTGRPGPVLVDMPKDVLIAKTAYDVRERLIDLPGYTLTESFVDAELDEMMALLAEAKQPVMLCGGGVVSAGAHAEILAFSERFQLPVASSLMGLGGYPADHPNYLGFCGMHGHYWTNIAIANADVLVVVGNRLNERQTGKPDLFARNAKIIHIDLDPVTLDRNVQCRIPIQGDIRNIFSRLLDKTAFTRLDDETCGRRAEWTAKIDAWKHRRQTVSHHHEGVLTPQYAIARIFHHLPADAFVTTEVGQHQMWAAQRFNLSRPRSFISSGGLGTMGFGFPAAIGVQTAFPDKTVIDIAGDGSFQMVLQELATARDYNLPVKVAIINNGHLGMIRQWQGKLFTRESHARMTSPDYVKLAEAYGCRGFVVTHPDEADAIIQEALAITDSPVLIDFRVHERSDVYPWVPAGGGNEEMWTEPAQGGSQS